MAKKQNNETPLPLEELDSGDLFDQLLKNMRENQSGTEMPDSIRIYTHIIKLIEAAEYFYQNAEF